MKAKMTVACMEDLHLHRVNGHLHTSIDVTFNTSGAGIDCFPERRAACPDCPRV